MKSIKKDKKTSMVTGFIMVIAAGLMWGTSDACGQYVFDNYPGFSSIWLTTIRCQVAGALLVAYNLAWNRKAFLKIWENKGDVLYLIFFALGGVLLNQYSTFKAIQVTNAGTASVLQELNMLIVLFVACFEKRKGPGKTDVVAIVLALFGVFMLSTHGDIGSLAISPAGLAWGLGAAFCAASNTLLSRRIVSKYGGIVVMSYAFIVAGTIFPIVMRVWTIPLAVSGKGYLGIAGVVFLGTLFVYAIYTTGITIIGPEKASMLIAIEPVTATVLSVVWLGTRFMFQDIIGFVCIIIMVFILTGKDLMKKVRS